MGFFDDLKSAFSGGSKSSKKSSSGSKDKSSVQKQINAEQARIGKGNWNQKLNDLVKQRDNAGSGSSGIAALKNAPKNIARDIGMGLGMKDRDADYYRRTANTIARTQGADAANRYIKQMTAKGGDAAAGVKNADVSGSVDYGQRTGMLNVGGGGNDGGGIASLKNTGTEGAADDMSDQYAENLRRYNEYMQGQNALTVMPQQREVTPDMRRAALDVFESQRGAGQMPYYMAAAANSQAPDMSPAFQYAAQNYATLGGSQRLGPRPMEMMSVAERRQINDMAQGMADQQAAENDYQAGMDMILRGGGKGGPRTGPQLPPGMVGLPRDPRMIPRDPVMMPRFGGKGGGGVQPQLPPNYGGGMPRPPLPFASILASRFGGFGGQ